MKREKSFGVKCLLMLLIMGFRNMGFSLLGNESGSFRYFKDFYYSRNNVISNLIGINWIKSALFLMSSYFSFVYSLAFAWQQIKVGTYNIKPSNHDSKSLFFV